MAADLVNKVFVRKMRTVRKHVLWHWDHLAGGTG